MSSTADTEKPKQHLFSSTTWAAAPGPLVVDVQIVLTGLQWVTRDNGQVIVPVCVCVCAPHCVNIELTLGKNMDLIVPSACSALTCSCRLGLWVIGKVLHY